jgi:hypothetical protein
MYWDYDGLWQKAKLYAQRAMASDRDDSMFPFWATLSLEFLARATLSKVNPCLLADPKEGSNMLYACGFASTNQPVSINAKTVFLRCQRIVSNFTQVEYDFSMALVQRRNEELHTASAAFEDFPTRLWLAKFFRVCHLLLAAQGRSLEDVFGPVESRAAREMIDADEKRVKKQALDLISAATKVFEAKQKENLPTERKEFLTWFAQKAPRWSKLATCPACGEQCLTVGEHVRSSEPRLEENEIIQEVSVLPTQMWCPFCLLQLGTHALLHGADLGGQYSITETRDPVEFHGIEIEDYLDPTHHYEEEYGND